MRVPTGTEGGAPPIDAYYAFETVRKAIEYATNHRPPAELFDLEVPTGLLDYSNDARAGVMDAIAWGGCVLENGLIQRRRDVPG